MARASPIVPAIFTSWVKLLVPDKCFDEFFIEFNLLNVPCYKLVLSKVLGYFIVCSSLFVKVPQIMKVWNAKSGEGLSMTSLYMELAVLGSAVVYCTRSGYPFSTYGELICIALQSCVLTGLVLHFSGKTEKMMLVFLILVVFSSICMTPMVPMAFLTMLQALNTIIGLTGKTLQVLANYNNGSTGLLSGITVFMFLFNGTARIYTTVQEVGDRMIIFNYFLVTIVNCVIAGQVLYYWNTPVKKQDEERKSI